MAPRKADDCQMNKRVAAAGCRLPVTLPVGKILTDITQKDWILGPRLGSGGFGDIYLASDDTTKPVSSNAKYVIKIEPHENGPLFVEMNFYIRAARQHMIESWCDRRGKERIGVPTYEGSGSHIYQKQRFRFLVIPRYGIDVGKVFQSHGRKLSTKLVNNLAVQMLDALEYIHSRGYAHSDVKGSNIVLDVDHQTMSNPRANLVDYGLAYRFKTSAGVHKPFVHDERRAHEGTLEFTSRDAHHGTHSRRGDMETLGYNILQWMCGKLPWEKEGGGMLPASNPEDVHTKKETYLANIPRFMQECFPEKRKKRPASITAYFTHIATLNFEAKPNYNYLRSLFIRGGKIDKTTSPLLTRKRVADENLSCPRPLKMSYLRERRPCRPLNGQGRITRTQTIVKIKEFSWEEVLARHPDKLAKIVAQPIVPDVVTLTPPPSPTPSSSSSSSSFSSSSSSSSSTTLTPTYAMLQVLQRIKERRSGVYRPKSKINEETRPKWMTPAMAEVSRLKKKVQSTISIAKKSPITQRLTRSCVASRQLRLKQQQQQKNRK